MHSFVEHDGGRDDEVIDEAQVALFRSIANRISGDDFEKRFESTLRNLLTRPKAGKIARTAAIGERTSERVKTNGTRGSQA